MILTIRKIKKDSDKYAFPWCKDCGLLEECYYYEGHGEVSDDPDLIDPNCIYERRDGLQF